MEFQPNPVFDEISQVSQASQINSLHGDDTGEPRFVISVDYGTTYTGVAWILTTGQPPSVRDILPVLNWPGAKTDAKVPSTYTYSASDGSQCWGHGIGKNALVIRLTKLHIEPPNLSKAFLDLKQTISEAQDLAFSPDPGELINQVPRHLIRTNEDVMTDYLEEVLIFARKDIEKVKEPATLSMNPIDLVITHPAEWAPKAKNITFRAVVTAFRRAFSDINYNLGNIRLASEPEACAQYIRREALDSHRGHLRPGECFIVVDAGGGTVDIAAYRVDSIDKSLSVTRVGDVIGGRFGSTEVDKCFLHDFLRHRPTPEDYQKLMTMGGTKDSHGNGTHVVLREGEQIMLNKFLPIKHKFKGQSTLDGQPSPADRLSLPNGIGSVDSRERNIIDGELIITPGEMAKMFDKSVKGTLELIVRQLVQLDTLKLKVGTVFLSGGFSRNEYFAQCINSLIRRWRFRLLHSSDSWTAVSKGAVLMGLGIGCEIPPNNVPCPVNIGVVVSSRYHAYEHKKDQVYTDTFSYSKRARDHIHWVVKKNDLITPDQGIHASVPLVRKFHQSGNKSGIITIVLSSEEILGIDDNRIIRQGINAHQTVDISYDLGNLPRDASSLIRTATNPRTGHMYSHVTMAVEVSVSQVAASFQLMCGRAVDEYNQGFPMGDAVYPLPSA